MKNLAGKTFVFFGATGGIGEVVCAELSKAGANLVLVARNAEKLENLKTELESKTVVAISADASNLADVQKVFQESLEKFGAVDAVVISVGTWVRTSIKNTPAEIIDMNDKLEAAIAKPVVVVASAAQEVLRAQGKGVVFNMSSHAATTYLEGNLAYASAKAKTTRFILNLGEELKGTGVSTCDLQIMLVDTPQNRKAFPKFSKAKWAKAVQPADIARFIAKGINNSKLPASKFFKSNVVA